MSDEVNTSGYGYQDDTPQSRISYGFGLNAGTARLVKFEWTNMAGKDNTEGEALDIQFAIEGTEKPVNFRLFPVVKGFKKDGTPIEDPKSPEFQSALKDFNATVMHVLHCFSTPEELKAAFNVPIANFKDFCRIAMSQLPKDYDKVPLDIFFQWQYSIKGDNKQTYLEIPRKMNNGKWLCVAVVPVGEWKEVRHPNPVDNTPLALKYVDNAGNVHPFQRNGYFLLHPNGFQQKEEETEIPDEVPQNGSSASPETPAGTSGTW